MHCRKISKILVFVLIAVFVSNFYAPFISYAAGESECVQKSSEKTDNFNTRMTAYDKALKDLGLQALLDKVAGLPDPDPTTLDMDACIYRILQFIPVEQCYPALDTKFGQQATKFNGIIKTTFENKSSTTSLTNIAIAQYSLFKENLRKMMDVFATSSLSRSVGAANASTQDVIVKNRENCSGLTQAYLDNAKKVMMDNIKTTAAQKKATILLQKYQAINTKLRKLQFEIAKMYSYFMALNNKLKAFVKNGDMMKALF